MDKKIWYIVKYGSYGILIVDNICLGTVTNKNDMYNRNDCCIVSSYMHIKLNKYQRKAKWYRFKSSMLFLSNQVILHIHPASRG